MKRLIIAFVLLASPAFAQQQPMPSIQDQLATTYHNINTSLAKQLDATNGQVAKLTDDLAKAQARIKELEAKQEEKK